MLESLTGAKLSMPCADVQHGWGVAAPAHEQVADVDGDGVVAGDDGRPIVADAEVGAGLPSWAHLQAALAFPLQ